jgi:hypothetical protein
MNAVMFRAACSCGKAVTHVADGGCDDDSAGAVGPFPAVSLRLLQARVDVVDRVFAADEAVKVLLDLQRPSKHAHLVRHAP